MDNNNLFDKIISKITNIFKPKPKTYLLGDGKTLEVNGSISNPRNPISNLFNSIGTTLVDLTSGIKKYIDDSKIKNTPTIHSTALVENNDKSIPKQNTSLLSQGDIETTHIIPHNIKTIPSSTPKQAILSSGQQKAPRVYTAAMSFRGHKISDSIESHAIESIEAITAFRGTILKDSATNEIQIKHTKNKEI